MFVSINSVKRSLDNISRLGGFGAKAQAGRRAAEALGSPPSQRDTHYPARNARAAWMGGAVVQFPLVASYSFFLQAPGSTCTPSPVLMRSTVRCAPPQS
jgi:hypothetical protein